MKFGHLLLGMLFVGATLSSCNLDVDEENNMVSDTFYCANLIMPADGETFATSASYKLNFYLSGNMQVTTSNLSLGTGGAYSFASSNMPYVSELGTYNGQKVGINRFSMGKASANGLVIDNIQGCTTAFVNLISTNDPLHDSYKWVSLVPLVMSYTANYDYIVKTFMPDAIYNGTTTVSTIGDASAAPRTNDGIRYRVVFKDNYKKASIFFYEANFGDPMPAYVTVNFVLEDLEVEFLKNGYKISGLNLIPTLYGNGGWDEFPAIRITSFEFINTSDNLTTGTASYQVSAYGRNYDCMFNGAYCYTKASEEK